MRHVSMTCKNHPTLRWSCKEIAVSNGKYNGSRNIQYCGTVSDPVTLYADGSGVKCDYDQPECDCPASALIEAPEDHLIKREDQP